MRNQFTPDRLENLERLQECGEQPYLADTPFIYCPDYEEGVSVSVAGRILTIRRMGKMCFATIMYSKDTNAERTSRIQVVFQQGFTDDGWRETVKHIDTGDIVFFQGFYQSTVAGEQSIFVRTFRVLTKALTTVPYGQEKDGEAFNQVRDPETLMRHRHLAMLTDDDLRARLIARSRAISTIRHALDSSGFVEAQTPVLLQIPGGAEAKTFDTRYNAYNADVKLRISLEIQLKKLLCGGFDRVYEIGTVFRNEGISAMHNPEFTLLEYYTAYEPFASGLERFRTIISQVSHGEIPFDGWEVITMREAIENYTGSDIEDWYYHDNFVEAVEKAMKTHVEPNLTSPTIITHHPAQMSPLARHNGMYAERFEAYINGMEIANGFCEQNDPRAQLAAFEAQNEAYGTPIDHDFIYALACGMPPAFGVGIGIDRLVMALTGAEHIRQTTWFPYVKPEN
jgi:lysyl-tRNA synthetase class 2